MSPSPLTETLSVSALCRVTPRPGRAAVPAPAAPAAADRLATFRDLDDPARRVRLPGLPETAGGVFTLTVVPLCGPADAAPAQAFGRCVHPWLVGLGGELTACWIGAPEADPVIAWLTRFDDEAAQRRHGALLAASGCLERPEWRAHVAGAARQRHLAPALA